MMGVSLMFVNDWRQQRNKQLVRLIGSSCVKLH